MSATLPEWKRVWRGGFAPIMPIEGLQALATALQNDDPRLTQGSTTTPPPLMCVQDWICEAGCLLGFCGVVKNGGFGVATVGQAESWFADACFECDRLVGYSGACRYVLSWFDDTPRDEMRRLLLEEVTHAIQEKETGAQPD